MSKVHKKEPRDTQFAGFAKLLWAELEQAIHENHDFIPEGETMRSVFIPMIEKLIAQRAHDLVEHTVVTMDPLAMQCWGYDEIVAKVPDLLVWSENGERR